MYAIRSYYVEYNTAKIIDSIITAEQNGAELVIFSELAICGYSPLDMLEQKAFVEKCVAQLDKICAYIV